MPTVTIAPTLDFALRQAIASCKLRLAPNTRSSEIIAVLQSAHGVTASVNSGFLEFSQNGGNASVPTVLTAFAGKHADLFLTSTSHPSTWTTAEKVAFLRTHTPDEYQRLCGGKAQRPDISLDPQMCVEDWRCLSFDEKNLMMQTYDNAVIAAIQGRHKRTAK